MKTLAFLLAVSIALVSPVKAGNEHDGNSLKNAFSKTIKSHISMPQALKEKTKHEKITVYFIVNECGEVVEVNAKTRNKQAKTDLENQFKQMNFKGLEAGKANSVDLNFIVY